MSPRALAQVLIRVLGVGFLAHGILVTCMTVLQMSFNSGLWDHLGWSMLTYTLLHLVIAVFLIRQADWIVERIGAGGRTPEGAPATPADRVLDPAVLFRVGCALIGVFCLTQLAGPVATLVHQLTRSRPSETGLDFPSPSRATVATMIQIGVNLALAIVLIVGPGRVGRWLRATFTVRRAPSGEPPTA
jgi:hypothetical protein